jgi:hypothetical protein
MAVMIMPPAMMMVVVVTVVMLVIVIMCPNRRRRKRAGYIKSRCIIFSLFSVIDVMRPTVVCPMR